MERMRQVLSLGKALTGRVKGLPAYPLLAQWLISDLTRRALASQSGKLLPTAIDLARVCPHSVILIRGSVRDPARD